MDVEKQPVWFTTGNPFVDTGQEMMAALAGAENLADLAVDHVRELLPLLVSLYMKEGWRKNLFTIFPDSKLTNGSVKRPREEYLALLKEWLELVISADTSG